jgi:GMP synthase-like glutamine amidotransferase
MASLRVHVLQQTESTPPGSVLDWLKSRGHAATLVRVFAGDSLPSVDETDWLIICGGDFNVDETEKYPFLVQEKKLIHDAIAKKKTLLGLCLGGQLLAQSLGAAVKPNTEWEVGWHTVHFGQSGADRLMVFQWHQDTFDLPTGAIRVATNRITENQGFAFGDNIVGLQFHPEATEEWVTECANDPDMPAGAHVQTKEQILEGMIFLTPLRKWFFDLLQRLETITVAHSKK